MIHQNAKVADVRGDPLHIHFNKSHKAKAIKPVPYTAQALVDMPAQVAYQAINLAETAYMNDNYAMIVAANLTLAGHGVFGETLTCVSVANEVAEWEFISMNSCGWHERIYTDLEANIITTPDY